MKNIFIIMILLCFSCIKQINKESTAQSSIISKNTFVIKEYKAVIHFSPNSRQLDSIKKTYKDEEDFYTIADDGNYYFWRAMEYLKKNNVKYDTMSNIRKIYLSNEKRKISIPKEMRWGGFFIYEKGKLEQFIYPVEVGDNWIIENGEWKELK